MSKINERGKINIKIIVSNIENWGIDWSNESKKQKELDLLNQEIKSLIYEHLGIEYSSMKIESELSK